MDVLEAVIAAFALLLGLGSLGGSFYLIARAFRWRALVDAALWAPPPAFAPPATLIVPTRGDFASLEANLRSIARLAYPDLQMIFAVDERSDPLFAACESIAREFGDGRIRVVAVEDHPAPPSASGKCAAHLRALREVRPQSEVIIFADDDIRPSSRWLQDLVAPLGDDKISVATAYRWYFAGGGGLWSHTRSAWNLVGAQIMFSPKYNFAWGGGMAIRRKDFDQWQVAKGWERAISDDYVVTIAAKKDGRPIQFVAKTLVPAYETVGLRAMLEWCRRQSFMTKIYDPALWKFAAVPYLYFNGLMVLGVSLLAGAWLGVAVPVWALVAAIMMAAHLPLNLVKAAVFYRGIRRMLVGHDEELRKLFLPFLAGAALAPFVMIYALWKTRDLRIIEWRGKQYEVKGPLDVRPL